MKYNSKSLINKLINIENIRLAPGWLVNIVFPPPVASLKMMFSCLYLLDAYDLAAEPLPNYHLPTHPHT